MVDIMPVVAAENAVPGKRRIAGLAEVGVLRAGIIPEDDVQGSLDVPGAIGALDDAALGDIGVALGVDAAVIVSSIIAHVLSFSLVVFAPIWLFPLPANIRGGEFARCY